MENKILLIIIIVLIVSTNFITAMYFLPSENQPPIVIAAADKTCGKAPLIIKFNGSAVDSESDKILYYWDFGDGATSNEKNPIHNYTTKGRYAVRLIVKDEKGNIGNDSLIISVMEYYQPLAIASVDINYGKAPLSVQFKGSGVDIDGDIIEYHWDFGDGQESNNKNPTYEYTDEGQYFAYLTVIDNDGLIGVDHIEINAIPNCPPRAYASADKTEGRIPLKIKFTGWGEDCDDTELNYNWNFGIKTIIKTSSSTEQNPEFTYWKPGEYTVKLKVSDNYGGEDTVTLKIKVKGFLRSGSNGNSNGSSNNFQNNIFNLIIDLIKSSDPMSLKLLLNFTVQFCKFLKDFLPFIFNFISWIFRNFILDGIIL
jgi:PKD repeat protein